MACSKKVAGLRAIPVVKKALAPAVNESKLESRHSASGGENTKAHMTLADH